MIVIITETQKNILIGQQYTTGLFFNPIQDLNDNWVISIEEMEHCTNVDFLWVKDLTQSIYQPKPQKKPI